MRVGVLFNGIGNTTYYRAYTDGKDNVGYIPFYEEKYGNILTIAADPANRWIPADYDDTSIPAALRENPNALFPRLSYGKITIIHKHLLSGKETVGICVYRNSVYIIRWIYRSFVNVVLITLIWLL